MIRPNTHVKEIIETRTITLPIPPSDNARLTLQHDRNGRCSHRIILTSKARQFLEDGKIMLKSQWPRSMILVPSFSHQLHITVTAYVSSWRGDCSNYTKLLKDVMTDTVYDDDKFVHINYTDTIKDVANPRVVLSVPIDLFSEGDSREEESDSLRPAGCTCSYPLLLKSGWQKTIAHHPKCELLKP